MGRNKAHAPLSKAERKRVKNGARVEDNTNQNADLVAWRQNLTERWGDLDAATRTARRTVLNSSFWADRIRAMA